jgi:uncharacterized coiled-coil protein SlyX
LNTAIGGGALGWNATGESNVALGHAAGGSQTDGSNNVYIGPNAGSNQTDGNRNVYIGYGMPGIDGENDSCYIGSIFGQTSSGGTPVYVNLMGKLGTTTSSRRFKEDIKPMNSASETLFALKPVTFRYKKEIDPKGLPQFGLVAEEVDKVDPDLVVRDKEGKVNTVRYDQINAMLLNEFLKEHRKVEEQQATIGGLETTAAKQETTIAELKSTVAKQEKGLQVVTARLEEQDSKIQKVSAQLEASKPAPQVVNNP